MSLIDQSYFIGSLTIAQLGQPAVLENLGAFINHIEPEILQAALGYELWEDFVDGLSQPSIDQKWLDLRDGVTFESTGLWPPFNWTNRTRQNPQETWFIPQTPFRRGRWVGFCGSQSASSTNPTLSLVKVLIAGTPNAPVPNTDTYTSSLLSGSNYSIERRGFGTMVEGVDVETSNNGQTITLLKFGDKFANGEVFILHFNQVLPAGAPSVLYYSPIAGIVYYEWFRDQASNLGAMGVVQGENENAKNSKGMLKMSDAFKRAAGQVSVLWSFLDGMWRADPTVYPSYDRMKIDYQYFKPVNQFGI